MSFPIASVGKLRTGARVSRRADEFVAGSTVTWFGEFRDPVTGALTGAGGVVFLFRAPDGVEIEIAGGLVSAGVYGATIAPIDVGTWAARLFAGGVQVDERSFVLTASVFDPDAETPVVLVDDDGEYILLDDGLVMEG